MLCIAALSICWTACPAQTAQAVLDKTAAVVSHKGGATASFTIGSKQYGNTSGTIAIKGRKFNATTPQAIVWFDGKTQWTYMKQNDEVNVSNPTEAQLQALNPYNFIYLYKRGYKPTMTTSAKNFEVHLTATDKNRSVQELYITIDKKSYTPTHIRMRQGKQWTDITVTGFKQQNIADARFRFNAKDYPQAEVIDLR